LRESIEFLLSFPNPPAARLTWCRERWEEIHADPSPPGDLVSIHEEMVDTFSAESEKHHILPISPSSTIAWIMGSSGTSGGRAFAGGKTFMPQISDSRRIERADGRD